MDWLCHQEKCMFIGIYTEQEEIFFTKKKNDSKKVFRDLII